MKTSLKKIFSKMSKCPFVVVATLFFISFLNVGLASPSLEWQKLRLEEKIMSEIDSSVSGLLERNQYFIDVNIDYSDPGMPNFDDLEKTGLKVSDIDFDKSSGGYIAFSKVGLEVPVLEKYNQENQRKLKELYRFNESYDLFKNIEAIGVSVFLSDSLDEALISKVKKVTNSLRLAYGDVTASFTFEVLPLENKIPTVIKPKEGMSLKDILNFIARFGNAIGLILATLLFGIVTYLLMKKYWELKAAAENNDQLPESIEEEKGLEADENLSLIHISEPTRPY